MAKAQFVQDGKTYAWDVDDITTMQAIELKKMTGWTVPEWMQGLQSGDAEAFRAFVWLARKVAGDQPEGRYSDFDFPLIPLMDSFEVDEQPDPTRAAPASKPRSKRTGRSSPISSD